MTRIYTIEAYREKVNNALDQLEQMEEERVILVGQDIPGKSISISAPSGKDYKRFGGSSWAKDAFQKQDGISDLYDGNSFFMHTLILPRKHVSEVAEENLIDSVTDGDGDA